MIKTDDPILIDLLLEYTLEAGISALNSAGYGVSIKNWTPKFEEIDVDDNKISLKVRVYPPPTNKYKLSWFYKAIIDRRTGEIIRVYV